MVQFVCHVLKTSIYSQVPFRIKNACSLALESASAGTLGYVKVPEQ
jgi:hypothetical protein